MSATVCKVSFESVNCNTNYGETDLLMRSFNHNEDTIVHIDKYTWEDKNDRLKKILSPDLWNYINETIKKEEWIDLAI